ncbi:unnamed protein product [Cuscuta campestris]|uniref:Rad21/Rec8-like protein N-terminal domain-containing protein n=1 Tax=Cuscuta campestris TaxID=132261 RepID=A0A484LMF6_9ASTE|nr:unnamed protein product [Cuscuta campestris]
MAATMHAKMNRKKLSKINITKICEEILNPSVPMALRLSGILMGGVVIVFQRKVKLLYDDVNRFLVEVNEAWKVKAPLKDPTPQPKNKPKAKREAVTLQENQDKDHGSIEHPMLHSDTSKMTGFQQTTFAAMNLDNVENQYINVNLEDPGQDLHQVDADNITLFDHFESHRNDTKLNRHFERFDIEGDEETQTDFATFDNTQIPDTLIPSPPEQQEANEIQEQHPKDGLNPTHEGKGNIQPKVLEKPVPPQRRARKPPTFTMDNDEIVIPGHIYQDWLKNCSDIVSRRGRKRKYTDVFATTKVARRMDIPPHVLMEELFTRGSRDVHYPKPLLNLWVKSTQLPHGLPFGRTPGIQHPEQPPSERTNFQDPSGGYAFDDFHSGVSPQVIDSIEKHREAFNKMPRDNNIILEELRNNVTNIEEQLGDVGGVHKTNIIDLLSTPGGSGNQIGLIPSSPGSELGFRSLSSDINSGKSNRKRPYSSSRHSGSSLEPVAEDCADPNFKMTRLSELSETGFTPDNEILMETGPTQTQIPRADQPFDKITDSIRRQLKTHFDMPGSPKVECLNDLTVGMSRKQAACMFYQTCVLATQNFIRVEQKGAYEGILISRGAEM